MQQQAPFSVAGLWVPSDPRGVAEFRIVLTNHSDRPLNGFRLALSGPLFMLEEPVRNCRIVSKTGSFGEIAPIDGVPIPPGGSWEACVSLTYKAMHWTDGAVTAAVIEHDGRTTSIVCPPTRSALSTMPQKSGAIRYPPASGPMPLSIIPWPNKVDVSGARTAPSGLAISASDDEQKAVLERFTRLVTHLFPGEALVRSSEEGGLPIRLQNDAALGSEAYRVDFAADSATIFAAGSEGYLYGLITLGQILRGSRLFRQHFVFPTAGSIEDEPAMAWRGCHFDVARQFFAAGEVEQFLRILAWNKLNRFHWHLSEDEAWRVEIDAFPELTRIGAWRGIGLAIPPQLGSGAERSGGFYSKQAVSRIVSRARELGIEVIPEIDMPGHCYAMIQSLAALRDRGENGTYLSGQRFANNCLNPALDATYEIVGCILEELLELFPGRWFHIGGDEVPRDAWTSSPAARSLSERIGGGVPQLQAHFLRHIQQFLRDRGRIVGAWEEAADGGGIDKDGCYLIGWRSMSANRDLAAQGYDVVVSPGQRYYLDMANGPDWHEPGASWAGWSSPRMTYEYAPDEGWSAEERRHFTGVQGAIWCEPMTDRAVFDRLVFPRLSAIAETGWTHAAHKDWRRFSGSIVLMPSLYGHWEG